MTDEQIDKDGPLSLTDREKEVLKDRFGIDMDSESSLKLVAEQFDETRKRIGVIERNALRKLLQDAVRTNSPSANCFRCGRKSREVPVMLSTRSGATMCEDCVRKVLGEPDD